MGPTPCPGAQAESITLRSHHGTQRRIALRHLHARFLCPPDHYVRHRTRPRTVHRYYAYLHIFVKIKMAKREAPRTRGRKRRIPTQEEIRSMCGFQKKLHLYVGSRPVAAVAREIGIGQSTLQRWLEGQSPTLGGLKELAAGTGLPVAYWADDSVPERTSMASHACAVSIFAQVVTSPQKIVPQATDPRALEVYDDSMSPLLEKGQVAVYDAAPDADVRDCDLVAVRLGGKLTVRRRQLTQQKIIYSALNPAVLPVIVSLSEHPEEHPVVAIIRRPHLVEEAQAEPDQLTQQEPPGEAISEHDTAYMVAEEEAPYGKRKRRRDNT